MFEIGSSLREARERRGVQLGDVERQTRIRTRYLRALEEDRFDVLPGQVYAKGFLRTYADYLGLDADRFVEELGSRLPPEDDEPPPQPPVRPIRGRRVSLAGALVAGSVAVAAVAAVAWVLVPGSSSHHAAQVPRQSRTRAVTHKPAPAPRPVGIVATLVLRAANGRSWIEAHAGSQSGTRLYYATLEQGRSLRLTRKRLWLRLGDPTALVAILNGKVVSLPESTPVDVVVTSAGVQTVA